MTSSAFDFWLAEVQRILHAEAQAEAKALGAEWKPPNLAPTTIRSIRDGRTWRHIERPAA